MFKNLRVLLLFDSNRFIKRFKHRLQLQEVGEIVLKAERVILAEINLNPS